MPEPCHGVFPLQGGRQWCSGEVDAVPREHPCVARNEVSLGKSFLLLNLDAKMLLGGRYRGQRQGCWTQLRVGGDGTWLGASGLVKTAMLLQWQVPSRRAAWLEPLTLL